MFAEMCPRVLLNGSIKYKNMTFCFRNITNQFRCVYVTVQSTFLNTKNIFELYLIGNDKSHIMISAYGQEILKLW